LAAATGGAALGAFGTAAGAGGFIGGAVAAGVGYTYGTMATSMGNHAFFGDPMPTAEQFVTGLGVSMLTGGVINGTLAASSGNNFWSGNPVAQGRGVFSLNNTPKSSISPSVPKLNVPAVPQPELHVPEPKPLDAIKSNNNSFTVTTTERPQMLSLEGQGINIQRPQINGYINELSLKTDLYHSFPTTFDDVIVQSGGMAQRISDGAFMFTAPGTINGVQGVYTIGTNQQNIIFHRCFYEWSVFLRNF
jgi:hypothetical protein